MIVEVRNLKKRYKKQMVLKGIDITVETPQIIALVGPNGSGKTTMLNCMTNLLSFQEGEVRLLGKKHTDASLFHDVSYLQDNRILYGNLTGYDHLKFICSVQKIPYSKIKEVAERVGMEKYMKQRVRNYSLGMKQHLLLAMVIINEPKLLLMDEPLNGLDPTSAINMRKILLELYKEGTTIIVSSHNLDEIDRLTNTIYFMKDGALLKESLTDIASKKYFLTVSDVEKAKQGLTDKSIPFSETGQYQLGFEETDIDLQSFIDSISASGATILDIEVQKVGAEKRYRELFEEELSS
ncbi:ABC transporter ATP-binding protein [Ornithinibacillus halotolerans]|uniref:Bacitracin ABC transporter ATP-binding protein n=1 Tax=Ornithinibacillus halotolerans TaxID=1274357 RepID=A0A916W8L8_9BACI|nr:ABC transporter ATP-binding protein [Ornithinibacillus halotolerans]GGA78079.1 bacitracin ABC transporter ATP-binding protein [Ornithinibacillus halotolerans]